MSIDPKAKLAAPRRERRTPQLARSLALRSARNLLITQGPNAITLQAVASELGMSHTNLIHHFGSASGLQSALMHHMVSELTATLESAVERFRVGHGDASDFVNIVFDAFDTGGAGALAAWMMLSGEGQHLAPLGEVVQSYLQNMERGSGDPAALREMVTSATLLVTVAAFGDAVIGKYLRGMVGRDEDSVRDLTTRLLTHLLPTPPTPEPSNPD